MNNIEKLLLCWLVGFTVPFSLHIQAATVTKIHSSKLKIIVSLDDSESSELTAKSGEKIEVTAEGDVDPISATVLKRTANQLTLKLASEIPDISVGDNLDLKISADENDDSKESEDEEVEKVSSAAVSKITKIHSSKPMIKIALGTDVISKLRLGDNLTVQIADLKLDLSGTIDRIQGDQVTLVLKERNPLLKVGQVVSFQSVTSPPIPAGRVIGSKVMINKEKSMIRADFDPRFRSLFVIDEPMKAVKRFAKTKVTIIPTKIVGRRIFFKVAPEDLSHFTNGSAIEVMRKRDASLPFSWTENSAPLSVLGRAKNTVEFGLKAMQSTRVEDENKTKETATTFFLSPILSLNEGRGGAKFHLSQTQSKQKSDDSDVSGSETALTIEALSPVAGSFAIGGGLAYSRGASTFEGGGYTLTATSFALFLGFQNAESAFFLGYQPKFKTKIAYDFAGLSSQVESEIEMSSQVWIQGLLAFADFKITGEIGQDLLDSKDEARQNPKINETLRLRFGAAWTTSSDVVLGGGVLRNMSNMPSPRNYNSIPKTGGYFECILPLTESEVAMSFEAAKGGIERSKKDDATESKTTYENAEASLLLGYGVHF